LLAFARFVGDTPLHKLKPAMISRFVDRKGNRDITKRRPGSEAIAAVPRVMVAAASQVQVGVSPRRDALDGAAQESPGLVLGGIVIMEGVWNAHIFKKADSRGAWPTAGETAQARKVGSIDPMSTSRSARTRLSVEADTASNEEHSNGRSQLSAGGA
jgi:hypothetical protein